jgi:hypothetical protein
VYSIYSFSRTKAYTKAGRLDKGRRIGGRYTLGEGRRLSGVKEWLVLRMCTAILEVCALLKEQGTGYSGFVRN